MQIGVGRLADAAQPVDGAGKAELRRTEPGDEVAAPGLSPLLEHLEHAVHRRVPADDTLGEDGLARDDAVALEQLQRRRVRSRGGGRDRLEQRSDEAPPAGPGGWPDAGETARSRPDPLPRLRDRGSATAWS